jgi:hypothetical protein
MDSPLLQQRVLCRLFACLLVKRVSARNKLIRTVFFSRMCSWCYKDVQLVAISDEMHLSTLLCMVQLVLAAVSLEYRVLLLWLNYSVELLV